MDFDDDWTAVLFCAVFLILYFVIVWYLKVTTGRCMSEANLKGKVAVVTGANQGKSIQ